MTIKTIALGNGKWTAEAYNKPAWMGGRLHVVGEYASESEAQSSVAGLVAGYPGEWYEAPARLARWEACSL